jgi:uncharacterized protein YndB with AHSA1/START domain
VDTVTTFVPRDPETCWRAFTDVRRLASWVPGLHRADILSKAKGLAEEVHFEFASSLAYTLVYTYEADRHEVRWQPKLGRAAGVTGFARFDTAAGGTQLTYGLAHGAARTAADQELGDARALVAAFVAFVARLDER